MKSGPFRRPVRPARNGAAMPSDSVIPEITILIAANNEARSIGACLQSIAAQDYPMERVEVLIVDDRSTDGTTETAREAALGLELSRVRFLRIDEPPGVLSARQAALDLGIREAQGEIVLIAAAAGRLPREWVRELSGHLSYRDGGIIGPVLFAGRNPFVSRFESLDALVRFNLASWGYRHGRTWGLYSGNLALRREAYLATGGFPAIGFTLNEDQALGEALVRCGFSLRYLAAPAVQNLAASSMLDLLSRWRRRATFGASSLIALTGLLVLSNWLLIGLAAFGSWNWVFLLLARYIFGWILIALATEKYGSLNLMHWIWLYEPLMTLAMTGVYLSILVSPRWHWRGVTYTRKGVEGEPAAEGSHA